MAKPPIGIDQNLDEIMQLWPNAVTVFLRHEMLCVGCPISGFHTLVDACREYELDLNDLIEEIKNA